MRLISCAFIALLFLTSCILRPAPDPAAKEWMRALTAQDGQKLADLTCDADQTALQQVGTFFSALGILSSSVISGAQIKIGIDDLTYNTTRNDGSSADIHVAGPLHASLLLVSNTQNVSFTMPMVYEHSRWRFCEKPPGV
jgi:hypothetical protein